MKPNFALAVIAVLLAACQTDQSASTRPPPDYRSIVLANKNRLWKDPGSIINAQIAEPRLSMGIWQVCIRLNAKNSYGGYSGESDELIQFYEDDRPPWNMGGPAPYCNGSSYSPFPELNGDYRPAKRRT